MFQIRAIVPVAVILLCLATPAAVGSVAADDVTLTVTVVDSDGEAIGDIEVTAAWNESGSTTRTTAANGKVFLDVPDGADVEITVDDNEYVRNDPFVLFDATARELEVPVSRSAQATVTVLGASDPVEEATVTVSRNGQRVDRLSTDGDGQATTARLEEGTYTLRAERAGFRANATEVELAGTTETTIRLERGTEPLTVRVTDDHFEDPRPLANATVEIPRLGATLTTLSDGTSSTSVPVNRGYEVTVTKSGYETVTTSVSIGEEPVTRTVSIQRTDALEVESANDRVVVGESTQVTVTDEYESPVAGATVSVGDQTVGETDANGQASVPIESVGEATITVESGGLSASVTVEGVEAASEETPTAEATPTPTPTPTPGADGPGFGVVAALLALIGAVLLARR